LKGDDLLHAVRQWIERQQNWLLVLDNVDDVRLFLKGFSRPNNGEISASGPELFRFVPKCASGTVLWISRDKDIIGTLIDVDRGVHVGQMTNPEGLSLLRRLNRSIHEGNSSEAEDKLLQHLGHLPLAIVQAATYIRKTGGSVEGYLTTLKSSEERQSRLLDKEFIDRHRRSETPNSVMQTWLISMEQMTRESKDEETILRTAAFWDNQGLSFELLHAALGPDADEDNVTEAIGRMESFSFLQRRRTENQSSPIYDMHRLVQLAIRNSLDTSQKEFFSGCALRIIADIFPDGFYPVWDKCKIYLPHALKAAEWPEAEKYRENVSKLLFNVSSLLYWQGRFTEAVELQLRVLSIREEGGQKEDPATLRIMSRLGANYRQLGQFERGEELLLHTLNLQKKVLDERHPDTLTTMSFVATVYQHQRRLLEAEQLESEVLELRKVVLHECHQDTIRSMANLASIYQMQGRYDEAERLKIRVMNLRKSILGEEHPETLRTMNNLANSYREQGRLKEAEELGTRALEIQKRVLGEQHPDTVRSMASMGETYRKLACFPKAEQIELAVLELRRKTLGLKHPSTLKSMRRLVTTYEEQGRIIEATDLQMQLLDLQKEVLDAEHLATADTMRKFRGSKERTSNRCIDSKP
jgi:tetratricopeptide (TPR) repeat protein